MQMINAFVKTLDKNTFSTFRQVVIAIILTRQI